MTRAATAVGMSPAGAYKLHAHPCARDFAAAWDSIVAAPKPRPEPAPVRSPLEDEFIQLYRMGKPVGVLRRPARRLLQRVAALDRADSRD